MYASNAALTVDACNLFRYEHSQANLVQRVRFVSCGGAFVADSCISGSMLGCPSGSVMGWRVPGNETLVGRSEEGRPAVGVQAPACRSSGRASAWSDAAGWIGLCVSLAGCLFRCTQAGWAQTLFGTRLEAFCFYSRLKDMWQVDGGFCTLIVYGPAVELS